LEPLLRAWTFFGCDMLKQFPKRIFGAINFKANCFRFSRMLA